jgi:hypothetical protein
VGSNSYLVGDDMTLSTVSNIVEAAGSNALDAAQITGVLTRVSSNDPTEGVRLPACADVRRNIDGLLNDRQAIRLISIGSTCKIYPAIGDPDLSVNVLPAGGCLDFLLMRTGLGRDPRQIGRTGMTIHIGPTRKYLNIRETNMRRTIDEGRNTQATGKVPANMGGMGEAPDGKAVETVNVAKEPRA